MPTDAQMVKLSVAQRFGGRQPIVPVRVDYSSESKRRIITGYYLYWYREYIKFHMYNPATHRTIAEEEGIEKPQPVIIRINSNCSIKEVEFDNPFRTPVMTPAEIDAQLLKPRKVFRHSEQREGI